MEDNLINLVIHEIIPELMENDDSDYNVDSENSGDSDEDSEEYSDDELFPDERGDPFPQNQINIVASQTGSSRSALSEGDMSENMLDNIEVTDLFSATVLPYKVAAKRRKKKGHFTMRPSRDKITHASRRRNRSAALLGICRKNLFRGWNRNMLRERLAASVPRIL